MPPNPLNENIVLMLRWTRWNALLMFSLILCGLIVWYTGNDNTYYSGIEIELFRNFLFTEVPIALLILYGVVVVLTFRNRQAALSLCGYVVSLILYIPTILALYGIGFVVVLANMQDEAGPLDFLLPGIVILGALFWMVFTTVFFLGNGYLCFALCKGRFFTKSDADTLVQSKDRRNSTLFNTFSRIAVLGLLFGGLIGCDYFRLYRLETRHRYWQLQGQYEVLSIIEPHTLLLRKDKGSYFECDVEKKKISPISMAQMKQNHPQIAETIKDHSLKPLASTKLKDYGGTSDRSAVSPSGRWEVQSDNRGTSFLIDTKMNPPRIPLYHSMWVAFHRFTPDEKYLITQANAARIAISDVPIKLDRILVWKVPDLAD